MYINNCIVALNYKYSSKLKENVSFWSGKSVREFFKAYRIEISELINEYPKVSVELFLGMDKADMPFEKELIQAKILKDDLTGKNKDSSRILCDF